MKLTIILILSLILLVVVVAYDYNIKEKEWDLHMEGRETMLREIMNHCDSEHLSNLSVVRYDDRYLVKNENGCMILTTEEYVKLLPEGSWSLEFDLRFNDIVRVKPCYIEDFRNCNVTFWGLIKCESDEEALKTMCSFKFNPKCDLCKLK